MSPTSGSGVVIAAPASGTGKTCLTLGLVAALRQMGRRVAAAKTGPDYIDPRFLEAASGGPAVNLDPWAMRAELVAALAGEAAEGNDLLVIEGVMGLFDGPAGGGGSTADLAAMLGLPVVLVIDAARQGQSAAALAQGFAGHRRDCRIAGVILNRVAGERHAALVADAVEQAGIRVLGAVPRREGLALPSRHLGLVQAGEHGDLAGFVDRAGALVAEHIDLDAFTACASPPGPGRGATALPPPGQSVAMASDEAFGFAYPHLLAAWRAAGAELLPFSPLADEAPREGCDAVYLPGGYPELHAGRLSAATRFLAGLHAAAGRGVLIYGECGGFMVLGEALTDAEGTTHPMAGLLPLETSFAERRLQLGYRRLVHHGALPWPVNLRGHEFHYSVEARRGEADPLFEAADAAGRPLGPIGLRRGQVMGSYAHVVDMEG